MTDKQYLKITEQDMLIAEEFFDNNEKHFNEFIIAVMNYYRGKDVKIKTKNVEKYFKTYKKTMDLVIKGRETGGKKNKNKDLQINENQEDNNTTPPTPPDTIPPTPPDTQIKKIKEVNINKENNKENIYIENENLTDTDKQLQAFNNILKTDAELKKEFEELPKPLNIDTDYYKLFIEKWNEYVLKFTDRKTGISELTPNEKSQLKSINRPIKEISEGLFILFSQNDKETLPQCWTRPTHFLKQEQFLKYYEDAQNFKITKKITQFHK
jgi:hypothetical protein